MVRGTDLDVFSESGRVVVTGGLCITERFEDGVGREDLTLDLGRVVYRVFDSCF